MGSEKIDKVVTLTTMPVCGLEHFKKSKEGSNSIFYRRCPARSVSDQVRSGISICCHEELFHSVLVGVRAPPEDSNKSEWTSNYVNLFVWKVDFLNVWAHNSGKSSKYENEVHCKMVCLDYLFETLYEFIPGANNLLSESVGWENFLHCKKRKY